MRFPEIVEGKVVNNVGNLEEHLSEILFIVQLLRKYLRIQPEQASPVLIPHFYRGMAHRVLKPQVFIEDRDIARNLWFNRYRIIVDPKLGKAADAGPGGGEQEGDLLPLEEERLAVQ